MHAQVYLVCGAVTGHELALGAERVRQKSLAHVGALDGVDPAPDCAAFSIEGGAGGLGFVERTGNSVFAGRFLSGARALWSCEHKFTERAACSLPVRC